MKNTKKIFSIIMIITVLASIFTTSFTANAVSANLIDSTKTGSLNVYKYEMPDVSQATSAGTGEVTTDIPDSATALPGVTFKATRVVDIVKSDGTIDITYYASNGTALPTPSEASHMTAIESYTAVTDSTGLAQFSNLPLGIYLVQEIDAPSQVTGPVADFVVSVPMTSHSGDKWLYDVTVYPKNETVYSDITIKKTDLKTGAVLSGAEFDLYTSTDNSTWSLVESGLVTGEDGTVTPTNSLATSCYYKLVETKAPADGYVLDKNASTIVWIDAEANVCDPVSKVILDTTNPYLINIKNDKPTISKFVGTTESEVYYEDAVIQTVGDTVYYKVNVTIPQVTDMSSYTTLQLKDTLHEALTLNDTPELSGNNQTYTEGTHFVYALDEDTNTFTIDVLADKFQVRGEYLSLTLTYNCSVNKNLVNALGEEITNTAKIIYSAEVGGEPTPIPPAPEEKTSNETEVHTSGFEFKKTDNHSNALTGAKFKIYATKADALTDTNPLSFMDKNGNVINEAVSGDDGLVSFLGLGYGENGNDVTTGETEYYVVETYTPNNYNLLAEPVEVTVNQTSYLFENTQLTVVNSIKTVLPMTGGTGTMMFYTIGGLIVLVGGTTLIVIKKRKTKAN